MGLDMEQRETRAEGIGWERRRRKENRKRASCHNTSMSFPGVFLEFSKRSQAHLSRVGIGFLGLDAAVVDDVLERLRHEPPGASLVPVHPGAIHQVLGAQGHQIPGFQLHLRFQSSHGAEGPAGSAGALGKKKIPGEAQELPQGSPGGSRGEAHLVLHLGHASLVPPVQRLRDVTDGPGLGLGLECRIPTGTELEPRQRSRHLLAGLVGRKIPAGDSCSLRSPAEGVGVGIPRWESWVWGILSSLFFSV